MEKILDKIKILKYAYLICTLVNWISRALIFVKIDYGHFVTYQLGFSQFISFDFSWIGMMINFIPIIELHKLNRRKALIYGVIGCGLFISLHSVYLVLFFNYYFGYNYVIEYGYYMTIISFLGWCVLNIILLILLINRQDVEMEARVKKTILEFGTFLTRLKVKEISELTGANQENIVDVIENMIDNEEIYAKYFRSSNSVVFNRLENMDKINELMNIYNAWEIENIGKSHSRKI